METRTYSRRLIPPFLFSEANEFDHCYFASYSTANHGGKERAYSSALFTTLASRFWTYNSLLVQILLSLSPNHHTEPDGYPPPSNL